MQIIIFEATKYTLEKLKFVAINLKSSKVCLCSGIFKQSLLFR